jgi:hypothetical protein
MTDSLCVVVVVVCVQVACEGVLANVTVEPQAVTFSHILLHHHVTRDIVVTNKQPVTLYYMLSPPPQLPYRLTLPLGRTVLLPLQTSCIELTYEPDKVEIVNKQNMKLQVCVYVGQS